MMDLGQERGRQLGEWLVRIIFLDFNHRITEHLSRERPTGIIKLKMLLAATNTTTSVP